MNKISNRSVGTALVLTILTCGIYGIYWFVVLTDDIKAAADDYNMPSGVLSLVLTILTCGVYGLYWSYQMGKLSCRAKEKVGLRSDDNSIVYLVLQLLQLGIINYALIQTDLNQIADVK